MKKRKKRITVPVIMQMEALECGAASLAMILAYHGKWLPLEQVRSDCGVSRDGSKASSIAKAGRSYGFVEKMMWEMKFHLISFLTEIQN